MPRAASTSPRRAEVHAWRSGPALCFALVVASTIGFARSSRSAPVFQARYTAYDIAANATSTCVATADINGDGILDMVTAGGDAVFVLLGNGDGSFGDSRGVASVSGARCVAIGDLDGDGRPDLAVAIAGVNPGYIGTVSVLLGNGDGTFGPATSYPTGLASSSVAIGDVSGDARPDLVVTNTNSGTVSVLLGAGGGTFSAGTDFGTGAGPSLVVLADLNGDGKADVVATNSGSGTVSVLLGNGDGTFGPKTDFATGANPYSAAVADFNGDGRLDLVTANHQAAFPYPGSVSVLLGNGDGTFGPNTDFVTGNNAGSIAVGDFDRDGALDAAVARDFDFDNFGEALKPSVSLLFGTGDGGFRPGVEIPCGGVPDAVANGDVNRDGRLDIVTVMNFGVPAAHRSLASALLGNGDGTFGAGASFATGNLPVSVAIGDLNGDGNPDLATADYNPVLLNTPFDGVYQYNTVSVLLGDGHGGYGARRDGYTFPGSLIEESVTRPSFVALDDFDRDGRLDAVIATNFILRPQFTEPYFIGGVGTLLGDGAGTLRPATTVALPGYEFLPYSYGLSANISVTPADLNGDHVPDLVIVFNYVQVSGIYGSQSWGRVWALLGHGDGTFAVADSSNMVFSTFDSDTGQPLYAALGDFNGDAHEDLVVVNTASGVGSLLLGKGNGRFRPPRAFPSGAGVWNGFDQPPQQLPLAVSDLNGDGRQDLVVRNSVFLGNGHGRFTPEPSLDADPAALAIGDLDGDGSPDVAAVDRELGMVVIQPGNGDGTFRRKQILGVGARALALAMGDVNKDGWPDLVTSNSENTVSVLLNTAAPLASTGPPPIPAAFQLLAPRPNPSRARVQIEFQLPRSEAANVEIFDVAGRRTRTVLARQVLAPGDHVFAWDGRDASGAPARAGLYLIRVGAGSERRVGRVVLLGR